jgi:hypothetical protein
MAKANDRPSIDSEGAKLRKQIEERKKRQARQEEKQDALLKAQTSKYQQSKK